MAATKESMHRLRKYLVFWIIILGAFAPFAASVGAWLRSAVQPSRPVLSNLNNETAQTAGAEAAGAEGRLALELESHFDMVDVVNITHVGNGDGDSVFVIQMGIDRPVADAIYEAILVEALQGMDGLKTGEEKYYWVELLYGNWLVGRLECEARPYIAEGLSSEFCEYSDVDPASYLGDMIRWPGRENIVTATD